jgi:EAL and modified HD-GYP domain-containing signal transduction protein
VLRLLEKLSDPQIAMSELERLILGDPSLSYKLLRAANSAIVAPAMPIASLLQALQLVGLETLRSWASLFLLAGLSDKPRDVLVTAIVRACMCERLAAPVASHSGSTYFLVGLLSVLDILLDAPMAVVLKSVSLSSEIEQALVAHEGVLGETLAMVLDYEQGNWGKLSGCGLDQATIVKAYLDALATTAEMTRVLSG